MQPFWNRHSYPDTRDLRVGWASEHRTAESILASRTCRYSDSGLSVAGVGPNSSATFGCSNMKLALTDLSLQRR